MDFKDYAISALYDRAYGNYYENHEKREQNVAHRLNIEQVQVIKDKKTLRALVASGDERWIAEAVKSPYLPHDVQISIAQNDNNSVDVGEELVRNPGICKEAQKIILDKISWDHRWPLCHAVENEKFDAELLDPLYLRLADEVVTMEPEKMRYAISGFLDGTSINKCTMLSKISKSTVLTVMKKLIKADEDRDFATWKGLGDVTEYMFKDIDTFEDVLAAYIELFPTWHSINRLSVLEDFDKIPSKFMTALRKASKPNADAPYQEERSRLAKGLLTRLNKKFTPKGNLKKTHLSKTTKK